MNSFFRLRITFIIIAVIIIILFDSIKFINKDLRMKTVAVINCI